MLGAGVTSSASESGCEVEIDGGEAGLLLAGLGSAEAKGSEALEASEALF